MEMTSSPAAVCRSTFVAGFFFSSPIVLYLLAHARQSLLFLHKGGDAETHPATPITNSFPITNGILNATRLAASFVLIDSTMLSSDSRRFRFTVGHETVSASSSGTCVRTSCLRRRRRRGRAEGRGPGWDGQRERRKGRGGKGRERISQAQRGGMRRREDARPSTFRRQSRHY